MKALTVKQPWAWAILYGAKRVENRSWPTKYRGPLLIHAAKAVCPPGLLLPDGTPVPARLDYGAILGHVRLVDCIRVQDMPADPFVEGPWCWILSDPTPLSQPFPCNGALSLWAPPTDFQM